MFKTKLAVVISSVLLAAVTTQAQPAPVDETEATPSTQSSVPAETATSSDADAATSGASGNESVGSKESNVDEKSTSGSYYPYSSGTVGDDPSEPKTTSVPADSGDSASASAAGATDQWKNADSDGDGYLSQAELTKVAPTLAESFDDIDVDGDDKLTRGEFRTWHQSQKARMDADQAATPASPAPATTDPTAPSDAADTSSTEPASGATDE